MMKFIDGVLMMVVMCVVLPFTGTRRKTAQDHAGGANNRETSRDIASAIKSILGRK